MSIWIIWISWTNSLETPKPSSNSASFYKTHKFKFSARKRSCVSLLTRAGSKILSTPKRMRVIITKTIKVVEAEKEDNFEGVSVWQNGEQIPETDMAATTFAADGARVGIGLKDGH